MDNLILTINGHGFRSFEVSNNSGGEWQSENSVYFVYYY